ncbi:putative beta-carotene-binding protein [Sabethes cyaneus]|uniref:putative beta-carotene-binding protein n=1 Tax=Sabethes cyaneus TaxID=53552 RepID=UPI00237D3410|nr:putative beta-carotene-binding protein [Sabethes cyaneus]
MKLFLLQCLVVLNFHYGKSYVAPVLSVCSRNDPNLARCITDVVYRIRKNVADGNYGDGRAAPKLDPMHLPQLAINNGPGFRLTLTDVTIRGASEFNIDKLRDNLPEKRFDIVSTIPVMRVSGQYDLDMNILLVKATGKGKFNLVLNDTIASMRMEYQTVPAASGGKTYVRFNPIELKLKFSKARFNFNGLFNGDPALEEFGNKAINENPHLLLDEVKPSFERNLARIFTDISNSVVQGAEESELLPS